MAGDPKLEASQAIPDFPYAGYAELLGLRRDPGRRPRGGRRRLGRGAGRRPAGRATRRSPTPRCRRCRRTSNSNRRQPMAKALQGDPHGARIVSQSLKGKLKEFVDALMAVAVDAAATARRRRSPSLEVSAYTDPHRRAGVRRHAGVGLDDDRRRRGRGRRRARARLHLRRRQRRRPSSTRSCAAVVDGADALAPAARLGGDAGGRSATPAGPGSGRWRSPPSTSPSGT